MRADTLLLCSLFYTAMVEYHICSAMSIFFYLHKELYMKSHSSLCL
ncbi:hypothetical protein COPEUT_01632 [Coprococcus eutactus ATCC 27759]|nr:hypothetical protein COPEUT_01632 [Coprococcus eutactus ATCC 27759]